ncbi:addiction module protein [Coraliomargarita sp. SDUM461004]|uniref:Addiction module protein n=1 Tax=Thalassobacterium sedimentorum TaxID=3041258 RepID=A0ABU1ANQ1_9BACT|nr:addiction module protein [Coraliomargarita sp. SDUM461004]MDQ8196426.1 addiction module protein [Coraliomargarita sp. SDUM461004]
MSIQEIERMNTDERLQTMEALWDALCHEKNQPESPAWHSEILASRKQKIASGSAKFFSLDEASAKLQK